ncbi:fimbrial protein [Burkholderia territorii]|uniref:fimbrial protein n=1 Tax=Burkholderia territorii TaxID=1503055 RepID=UPI000AD850A5|nr:fimbrial protein [Burkholderia territorii]
MSKKLTFLKMFAVASVLSVKCGMAAALCTTRISVPGAIDMAPLNISGPSSKFKPGTVLGAASKSLVQFFYDGQKENCRVGDKFRMRLSPALAVVPGIQYVDGGKTYPIYETTIPGVGLAIAVKPVRAWDNFDWVPLEESHTDLDMTYSFVDSMVEYYVQATPVVSGPIKSGTYSFSAESVKYAMVAETTGQLVSQWRLTSKVSLSATVAARVCNVTSGLDAVVDLPAVTASSFGGVGSVSPQAAQSFSVKLNCEENVRVHATMTDANNPSNVSDVLSLSPDSTASGVGIRILRNNGAVPVRFGPDSSNPGTTNQWYITTTPSTGGSVTVPFVAKYVKSGQQVSTGSVKARSTITFSYQ